MKRLAAWRMADGSRPMSDERSISSRAVERVFVVLR